VLYSRRRGLATRPRTFFVLDLLVQGRQFWLLELALILRTNDFADLSHIALSCRSREIARYFVCARKWVMHGELHLLQNRAPQET